MATRNRILDYLRENNQYWVSGEKLSEELSISRAAVWGHICRLRESGYVIEACRNRGYHLKDIPDLLIAGEISQGLKTRDFGKKQIACFGEIDSTNARAKELAVQAAPEGAVVIANSQLSGRGRRGRSWFSPALTGIYMSLIIRPHISPAEAPKLTLMTSVALAEAIETISNLKTEIKWPNDILISGRKVAGILTEISTEMEFVHYIIIGIGINVNTQSESFPEDIKDRATSLYIESGRQYSRVGMIRMILEKFEEIYNTFKIGGFKRTLKEWKKRADIVGRTVEVNTMNTIYKGEVTSIDEEGGLIVKDSRGNYHRIISGDISIKKL
jgi:BirA family transcriptional regulator, biotin operon repressor / biotin---[acetyl-CoA-carboxylase] ligase